MSRYFAKRGQTSLPGVLLMSLFVAMILGSLIQINSQVQKSEQVLAAPPMPAPVPTTKFNFDVKSPDSVFWAPIISDRPEKRVIVNIPDLPTYDSSPTWAVYMSQKYYREMSQGERLYQQTVVNDVLSDALNTIVKGDEKVLQQFINSPDYQLLLAELDANARIFVNWHNSIISIPNSLDRVKKELDPASKQKLLQDSIAATNEAARPFTSSVSVTAAKNVPKTIFTPTKAADKDAAVPAKHVGAIIDLKTLLKGLEDGVNQRVAQPLGDKTKTKTTRTPISPPQNGSKDLSNSNLQGKVNPPTTTAGQTSSPGVIQICIPSSGEINAAVILNGGDTAPRDYSCSGIKGTQNQTSSLNVVKAGGAALTQLPKQKNYISEVEMKSGTYLTLYLESDLVTEFTSTAVERLFIGYLVTVENSYFGGYSEKIVLKRGAKWGSVGSAVLSNPVDKNPVKIDFSGLMLPTGQLNVGTAREIIEKFKFDQSGYDYSFFYNRVKQSGVDVTAIGLPSPKDLKILASVSRDDPAAFINAINRIRIARGYDPYSVPVKSQTTPVVHAGN